MSYANNRRFGDTQVGMGCMEAWAPLEDQWLEAKAKHLQADGPDHAFHPRGQPLPLEVKLLCHRPPKRELLYHNRAHG